MFMQAEPFRRALCDTPAEREFIAVFDDVDVLYSQQFAGSQGGVGIVGLVDVLEDDGDVIGTIG